MNKPDVPDPRRQTGSAPLREMSDRLAGLGAEANAAALAIAARAALRAIPLLERLSWDKPLPKRMRAAIGRTRMSNSAIVLGTLRAAATAWVAARYNGFGTSARFDEIKHEARMAGGAEDAGNTPASCAPVATHMAMMAAISVFNPRPLPSVIENRQNVMAARSAAQAVTVAAVGFMEAYDPKAAAQFHGSRDPQAIANRELSAPERAVWDAASEDAKRLEAGADASSLLMQKLWLTPAPSCVWDDWKNLSTRLLGRGGENWGVWIDWYEARLGGGAELSETREIARVCLPTDVWAQGAAVANAAIGAC